MARETRLGKAGHQFQAASWPIDFIVRPSRQSASEVGEDHPLVSCVHDALANRRCCVLKGGYLSRVVDTAVVAATPPINIHQLFNVQANVEMAINVVQIEGATEEAPHYHNSHVVAIVLSGFGWLETPSNDGGVTREEVTGGDIVVIPQDALHVFNTHPDQAILYVSLEFTDRGIDYQRHYR